ncbi:MAG: molybdenum cofactor guanylyltransferase [Thermodesulforhabdaceae bacterium]
MKSITGVILAGGKSSRFGRNKALEPFMGERLIDRSIRLIKEWSDPIFVVCQKPEEYFGVEANLVADLIPDQGPLMGLYTALLFSPGEWIFLRAVDMPFLEKGFAELLIRRALEGNADVIVPVKSGQYEPLCACYNLRCIPHIKRAIEKGGGRVISFFSRVRVDAIPEEIWETTDPTGKSILNINTLQDLDDALRELS